MLINTVILFLRDALPVFVLLVYLHALLKLNQFWVTLSLVAGVILSLLYVSQIQLISSYFQGNGVELFRWLVQCIIYLLTLLLGYKLLRKETPSARYLLITAAIMISLTVAAKGGHFMLYFAGYWQQNHMLHAMLLGTLLGIGICVSIAILLYLASLWLRQRCGLWITWLLLLLHATGQLTNALSLLVQIDLISSDSATWNSHKLISNQSETGYLFNVLFGYQATPSLAQLVLYFTAIFLPLILFYWFYQKQSAHSGNAL